MNRNATNDSATGNGTAAEHGTEMNQRAGGKR
jgi:hypothetical protein